MLYRYYIITYRELGCIQAERNLILNQMGGRLLCRPSFYCFNRLF